MLVFSGFLKIVERNYFVFYVIILEVDQANLVTICKHSLKKLSPTERKGSRSEARMSNNFDTLSKKKPRSTS